MDQLADEQLLWHGYLFIEYLACPLWLRALGPALSVGADHCAGAAAALFRDEVVVGEAWITCLEM